MAYFEIKTQGEPCEIYNLTRKAQELVKSGDLQEGTLLLWVAHTTCALTVIEDESGHRQDICQWLEKQIPSRKTYQHDAAWGDGNGYAHLRSFFLKPDLTVPVSKGKLVLGAWQNIVLLDFDNKPRTRRVYFQLSASLKA